MTWSDKPTSTHTTILHIIASVWSEQSDSLSKGDKVSSLFPWLQQWQLCNSIQSEQHTFQMRITSVQKVCRGFRAPSDSPSTSLSKVKDNSSNQEATKSNLFRVLYSILNQISRMCATCCFMWKVSCLSCLIPPDPTSPSDRVSGEWRQEIRKDIYRGHKEETL